MMRAMPPQRPDAVVFDNDGLLLDTESVWTRAEGDLFARVLEGGQSLGAALRALR